MNANHNQPQLSACRSDYTTVALLLSMFPHHSDVREWRAARSPSPPAKRRRCAASVPVAAAPPPSLAAELAGWVRGLGWSLEPAQVTAIASWCHAKMTRRATPGTPSQQTQAVNELAEWVVSPYGARFFPCDHAALLSELGDHRARLGPAIRDMIDTKPGRLPSLLKSLCDSGLLAMTPARGKTPRIYRLVA